MKTYLDCYPCFMRQALSAARRADASTEEQHGILLETMDQLRSLPVDATPPEMAEGIHRLVRAKTNNPDPYLQSKMDATEQALALLPGLMEQVRAASDPLERKRGGDVGPPELWERTFFPVREAAQDAIRQIEARLHPQ